MKRSILVIFVLLLYSGCKTDSAKDDLKQVLKEFEPTTQIFKINKDSLVELRGTKGTVLKIDPSVLQHLDGGNVESEIEVRLMELTSTEDLLRANAQTFSNGKWLMSGGAYKIQIFSENIELRIADGKSIEVNFPKIATKEMQLFDGNRDVEGTMNWELSNLVLKDKRYPVIIQKDTFFVLYNRAFAITMPVDTTIYKVLNRRFTVDDFMSEYKQVDSVFIKSDTINALVSNRLSRRDSLLISNDINYRGVRSKLNSMVNEVYESILVSRLGWIGADRFYPEIEKRVKFKLIPDHEMDGEEFFAIDIENNTVIDLYGHNTVIFDAPLNKRFYIVAFAIKDADIFAFKKAILIEEKGKLEVKYKKITSEEIDDYFKLD